MLRICDNRNLMSSAIAISANDIPCGFRKDGRMIAPLAKDRQVELRDWLKAEFERTGRQKKDLAKLWGQNESAVSRVLSGDRKIQAHEVDIARAFFEADHENQISENRTVAAVDDPELTANIVREIDGYGGMGPGGIPIEDFRPDGNGGHEIVDGVRARWVNPPGFMRHNLDATPSDVYIIKAIGDSMAPIINHNDRVLINTSHKRPSPPGIFAVWDGDGVVIKRIEQVSYGDSSRVRLVSENPRHTSYEVTLEQARIIGRVICKITAM